MFSFFKLTERELFLNWNNPVWKAQLANCTEKKPQAPQSQILPDYGQITTRPPKVKLLCVFSRHSELLSRGLIKVLWPQEEHNKQDRCSLIHHCSCHLFRPGSIWWSNAASHTHRYKIIMVYCKSINQRTRDTLQSPEHLST